MVGEHRASAEGFADRGHGPFACLLCTVAWHGRGYFCLIPKVPEVQEAKQRRGMGYLGLSFFEGALLSFQLATKEHPTIQKNKNYHMTPL